MLVLSVILSHCSGVGGQIYGSRQLSVAASGGRTLWFGLWRLTRVTLKLTKTYRLYTEYCMHVHIHTYTNNVVRPMQAHRWKDEEKISHSANPLQHRAAFVLYVVDVE